VAALKPAESLRRHLSVLLEASEALARHHIVIEAQTAELGARSRHNVLDVRRDQHVVADVGVGLGEEGEAGAC